MGAEVAKIVALVIAVVLAVIFFAWGVATTVTTIVGFTLANSIAANKGETEIVFVEKQVNVTQTVYVTPAAAQDPSLSNPYILDIITYNDVYEIDPVTVGTEKLGGPSRVSAYIKNLRSKKADPRLVLVTSAGDMISPSIMSSVFKGQQMIEINNLMGLNFSCVGNHEADFGLDVFHDRIQQSTFKWVSSNIQFPYPGVIENSIVDVGVKKVGIFAVTYDFASMSGSVLNLTISDPIAAATQQIAKLKSAGADFIIALSHLAAGDDCRLAAVSGINLILGGHDHSMQVSTACGAATYVKATQDWRDIWHIQVNFNFTRPMVTYKSFPVSSNMPTDPAIDAVVAKYKAAQGTEYSVVVGVSEVDINAVQANVRSNETNSGNFFTDVLREKFQADMALINGGGIRSNKVYPAGNVTKGDIVAMQPFINIGVLIDISGAGLKAALENGVSSATIPDPPGRFPQISGFQFTWKASNPAGSRVQSIHFTGNGTVTEVTPNMRFTLATISFLQSGGDGYAAFASATPLTDVTQGPLMTQIVLDAIALKKTIAPVAENRIVKLP